MAVTRQPNSTNSILEFHPELGSPRIDQRGTALQAQLGGLLQHICKEKPLVLVVDLSASTPLDDLSGVLTGIGAAFILTTARQGGTVGIVLFDGSATTQIAPMAARQNTGILLSHLASCGRSAVTTLESTTRSDLLDAVAITPVCSQIFWISSRPLDQLHGFLAELLSQGHEIYSCLVGCPEKNAKWRLEIHSLIPARNGAIYHAPVVVDVPSRSTGRKAWRELAAPGIGLGIWAIMLALGWLVFEITTQPVLGAFTACLKLAWHDAQAGWWLWRSDPKQGRGLANLLLFVGAGLWRVAVGSFVGTMLLFGLSYYLPHHRHIEHMVLGTVGGMFLGFIVSASAVVFACLIAWRSPSRLTLNSAIHAARHDQVWPSLIVRREHKSSRLTIVVVTSLATLILMAFFIYLFGCALLLSILQEMFFRRDAEPEVIFRILFLIVFFGGLVLMYMLGLKSVDLVKRHVLSDSVFECFGFEEFPGSTHLWLTESRKRDYEPRGHTSPNKPR